MKVNILSTYPPIQCGIGMTNKCLVDCLMNVKEEKDEVNIIRIDKQFSSNPFYFINLARKTKQNCDVIHVQYNHDCFGKLGKIHGFQNFFVYPILKFRNKKKIITTMHEVSDLREAGFLRKLFYKALNYFPIHLSDYIIVTTNKAKALFREQNSINNEKIIVLPLGAKKGKVAINKTEAKRKLGLGGQKVITLFGYIDTNKGHHLILEALPHLDKDIHFLIAGDARNLKGKQYKQLLEKKITELGVKNRVTFYGFFNEEENKLLMGATDLAVFPYNQITSSLALTTAISYTVPILASNIPEFRDFFEEHDCINLFNLGDQEDLNAGIYNLLELSWERERLTAKMKNFIQKHNWDEIAKETLNVYKNAQGS